MRHMSFALTTPQVRDGSKDVTRRLGWAKAKPGDRLMGVEKGQGLKKGEKVAKIREIEVVSNRSEPLYFIRHYPGECAREGFPEMTPDQFITMFCEHNGCDSLTKVNRIEFKYV